LIKVGGFVGGEAVEESIEIVSGEPPVEGLGDDVVAELERGQPLTDLVGIGEVVGYQHLALQDREGDLVGEPRRIAAPGPPQNRPCPLPGNRLRQAPWACGWAEVLDCCRRHWCGGGSGCV
jgi:hypothetical protein